MIEQLDYIKDLGFSAVWITPPIENRSGLDYHICGNDDTLDQTGRAYFGEHLKAETIEKTRSQPLWKHIQRLNLIRRGIPALQKGVMGQVHEWGAGISFVRDWNNGQSYAVVGLAAGDDQNITVVGVRNGTYRDAVTGNTLTTGNGSLSFHVGAHSAGIYVLDGPGKIGNAKPFLK